MHPIAVLVGLAMQAATGQVLSSSTFADRNRGISVPDGSIRLGVETWIELQNGICTIDSPVVEFTGRVSFGGKFFQDWSTHNLVLFMLTVCFVVGLITTVSAVLRTVLAYLPVFR